MIARPVPRANGVWPQGKTWIMSFGSLAKVLEPVSLVKEINDDLGKAMKLYPKP